MDDVLACRRMQRPGDALLTEKQVYRASVLSLVVFRVRWLTVA